MPDLDLPRGEERELVVDRDRAYELNGEDSRTLAAAGTFRVVPKQDLDTDKEDASGVVFLYLVNRREETKRDPGARHDS